MMFRVSHLSGSNKDGTGGLDEATARRAKYNRRDVTRRDVSQSRPVCVPEQEAATLMPHKHFARRCVERQRKIPEKLYRPVC